MWVEQRFRRICDIEKSVIGLLLYISSCNVASGDFDRYALFQSEMNIGNLVIGRSVIT